MVGHLTSRMGSSFEKLPRFEKKSNVDGSRQFVGGVPIGPSLPRVPDATSTSKKRRGRDSVLGKRKRRCARCVKRQAAGLTLRGDPLTCEGRAPGRRKSDGKSGSARCEFWDSTDDEEEDAFADGDGEEEQEDS